MPVSLQHAKARDSVPTLIVGRTADADVLLRAIESGAVTKIRPAGMCHHPLPIEVRQSAASLSSAIPTMSYA
jgi:hypothetical protein